MDVRNESDSSVLKWYRAAVKPPAKGLGSRRAANRAALVFQGVGVDGVYAERGRERQARTPAHPGTVRERVRHSFCDGPPTPTS